MALRDYPGRAVLDAALTDVGGTFTDTVLTDLSNTVLATNKTLTTHDNPGLGAPAGAQRALRDVGGAMGRVDSFIRGTTLATNALLERRGARVATITTQGFRDILEIAYERRYSQYEINLTKPDLLVPRTRAFTVPERMSVAGDPPPRRCAARSLCALRRSIQACHDDCRRRGWPSTFRQSIRNRSDRARWMLLPGDALSQSPRDRQSVIEALSGVLPTLCAR
ncbi:MAG: hydantoinase/oxoprolinase N-terminal domain-containing protein [Pseudomonadota bacterium]